MKLAVIGAGAMGGAIAAGLAVNRAPFQITVSNPHRNRLEPLAAAGCRVTADNADAAREADVVMVCVKPWLVEQVLAGILPQLKPGAQVGVVAAGVSMQQLARWLTRPGEDVPVDHCLVMPNTAMAVGRSMTFIVPGRGECGAVGDVMQRLGTVMHIEPRQLPGAMALASCGIAYALRYVRAAVGGGVQMGFKAADAQAIVAATLQGAAELLLGNPDTHAEAEIDKVTTPGGITIKGLNAMERAGFSAAVIDGLLASCITAEA